MPRIADPPSGVEMNQRLDLAKSLPILIVAACLTALGLMPARDSSRAGSVVAAAPCSATGSERSQWAAFSPTEGISSPVEGMGAVIWDAETGNPVRIFSAPGHTAVSVALLA